jgi:hypothetical protein
VRHEDLSVQALLNLLRAGCLKEELQRLAQVVARLFDGVAADCSQSDWLATSTSGQRATYPPSSRSIMAVNRWTISTS